MATNYFTMMRDVVGSYGEGLDLARDRKYQDEKRARETTEFNNRQTELQYQQEQRQGVDTAFANFGNEQAGIGQDTQRQLTQTYGMNPRQVAGGMREGGVEGLRGRLASYDVPDAYDLQTAPAQQGFAAPQLKTTAPTEVGRLRGLERIATASKDIGAMRQLGTERKGAEYDQAITTSRAAWDAKSNEEKAALVKQYSYDQNLRGHGNWVQGEGKTEGYMNFLPDKGNPIELSNKEVRDFFSLATAMEIDPARARKEMEGVSDKVRAVAKELFDTGTKVATETNNTRFNQGQLDVASERNAIARRAAEDSAARSANKSIDPKLTAESNRLYQEYQDAKTPQERAIIERQWNMVQGQIATGLGKTLPLNAGRPDSKLSPIQALTAEAERLVLEGHYETVPKAIEGLKRGMVKDHDNDQWQKIEADMVKNGAESKDIMAGRQAFLERRGYASPLAAQIIQSGVNPKTRRPLTLEEVMEFNERYPMSAVKIKDLLWVQNAARQAGLVNQIPR